MSMPIEVKAEHASASPAADRNDPGDRGVGGTLPEARLLDPEPTEAQVKWTMRVVWFMLIALALVCAIGPHIPSGE